MNIPAQVVGLRLYRINSRGDLIACEALRFAGGAEAVDTILRRAAISGKVEVGGDNKNHFADLLDTKMNAVQSVALDRKSYAALKNKWARCKVDHELDERAP